MVGRITHTIIHQFTVKVDHLTSTADYQILVSSDNATILGIGGCGTATQTQTATGVTAQDVKFIVHACAVGEATVTAEVRRTGTSRAEASVSQRVTVAAMPESVFEFPAGASQAAQQAVNRPGFVKAVRFPEKHPTSVKVTWHGDNHDETPNTANGGTPLTGFGLLFWRKGTTHPRYDQALVKGKEERSHTYSNLRPGTTYLFRIHACNDTGSCGHWTHPPLEVTTPLPTKPGSPQRISVDKKQATSARLNWRPHDDTGGVKLTGFGIRWRVKGASWPTQAQAVKDANARNHVMPGLKPGTTYEVSLQACNGTNRCSPWTAAVKFTTPQPTNPGSPGSISVDQRMQTSARLNWRPHDDTGGVRLTGFGIRWREKKDGEPWPTQAQAPNVPPGDQAYTIPGLKHSTTYEVSIQACNGRDRCSPWTPAIAFTTSGPERVVGAPPGPVRDLEITSVGDRTLTVDWEPPSSPNNAVTGYKLQSRQSGSSWPSTSTSVTASKKNISGLTNGTKYDVRVQACNGVNCGAWVSPVCGVPGTTTIPGQAVLDAGSVTSVGARSLRVEWAPPACISAISHYEVQHKEEPTGSWPSAGLELRSATVTTLTQLDNGTPYLVRVRACNTTISTTPPNDRARQCGAWSASKKGTPSGTPLPTPRNLDVLPLPQRHARLSWDAVQDATGYVVQFRERGSAWPASGSVDNRTVATPFIDIDLDGILRIIDRSDPANHKIVPHKGLGDEPAYEFRVQATADNFAPSGQSRHVIIIDTPIVEANGAGGTVKIQWDTTGTLLQDTDFATGSYQLRHRQSNWDITSLGWTPRQFDLPSATPFKATSNPDTLNLASGNIHAVQFIYRDNPNRANAPDADVFAARNVYVWPSSTTPSNGDRLATYHLSQRLSDQTIIYRICLETFGPTTDPRTGKWEDLIRNAFERWSTATRGLIRVGRALLPCAETTIEDSTGTTQTYNYKRMTDDILARSGSSLTDSQVRTQINNYMNGLRGNGVVGKIRKQNAGQSEIIMFNDTALSRAESSGALFEIADDLGYWRDCWFLPSGKYEPAKMCTVPVSDGPVVTRDIIVRRSTYRSDGLDVPAANARFNKCPSDSDRAYADMLHEIGHVLGLGGGDSSLPVYYRSHPGPSIVSVMNYEEEADCAPHPLDVMVIFALYQNRFKTS